MTQTTKGLIAMAAASIWWGLSGLYYKPLSHIPAVEVLAHRTLWSLVFFLALFTLQGRLGAFWAALTNRALLPRLALSSLMISVNWFGFIFAVGAGFATQAALGYYIFPLFAALLGLLVFCEALSPLKICAIALATFAVCLLTYRLGSVPWIAIMLASTFSLYGVLKKSLDIGPVLSVGVEVALLCPLALAFLIWRHGTGQGAFGSDLSDALMLAGSGILTALPLVFFSYATKRLTYASIGVIQYLNPTLQFLVATLVFREAFSLWQAAAFGLIWTGLALYSYDALSRDKRKSSISIA